MDEAVVYDLFRAKPLHAPMLTENTLENVISKMVAWMCYQEYAFEKVRKMFSFCSGLSVLIFQSLKILVY